MRPMRGHEIDRLNRAQCDDPLVRARVADDAHGLHRQEYSKGLTDFVVQAGRAQFADEDVVGALQQFHEFASDLAKDAHTESWPRKRMTVDHLAWQAEFDANPAHFVLEQFAK